MRLKNRPSNFHEFHASYLYYVLSKLIIHISTSCMRKFHIGIKLRNLYCNPSLNVTVTVATVVLRLYCFVWFDCSQYDACKDFLADGTSNSI